MTKRLGYTLLLLIAGSAGLAQAQVSNGGQSCSVSGPSGSLYLSSSVTYSATATTNSAAFTSVTITFSDSYQTGGNPSSNLPPTSGTTQIGSAVTLSLAGGRATTNVTWSA